MYKNTVFPLLSRNMIFKLGVGSGIRNTFYCTVPRSTTDIKFQETVIITYTTCSVLYLIFFYFKIING